MDDFSLFICVCHFFVVILQRKIEMTNKYVVKSTTIKTKL